MKRYIKIIAMTLAILNLVMLVLSIFPISAMSTGTLAFAGDNPKPEGSTNAYRICHHSICCRWWQWKCTLKLLIDMLF